MKIGLSLSLTAPRGRVTRGPELVTNSDMSSATGWTLGANWTIAGGVATKTTGVAGNLDQTIAMVSGRSYEIIFTVSGLTGSPDFAIGGTGIATLTAGTSTRTYTATANNPLLSFRAGQFAGLTLDNVSIKEILG